MINNSISIQTEHIQRRHFVFLALIFLISMLSLLTTYIFFPKIDPYVDNFQIKKKEYESKPNNFSSTEKDALKIPKTIHDAKILGNVLYKYSKHHRYTIMIAFFLTYIL